MQNPFESTASFGENPFADRYIDNSQPPSQDFISQCGYIKDQIDYYNATSARLTDLQNRQMNSISENEKTSILEEIDSVTTELKSLQFQIKNDIEDLKLKVVKSDPDMVHQLNNLNRLFRSSLKQMIYEEDSFKENVKNQAIEQYQIINPESSYSEAQEFILKHGSDEVFLQSLEQSNRKAEAVQVYENVKIRHDELVKINEMVTILNEMFNDLQDLVVEQDEVLNSAATNIKTAQDQMEKGDANVIAAVGHAKKGRKWKWIILVLIFLLILAIIGIVVGIVKGVKH